MSIARMSTIHNSYRYFTVSVDGYEQRCMRGVVYQADRAPGIWFHNFLEMAVHMDSTFDEMACPKQTVDLRRFSNRGVPRLPIRECNEYRNGELATFRIYVKYRYNASWQGEITWLGGEKRGEFDSFLQMLQMINSILSGGDAGVESERKTDICQIAVNSCEKGLMEGSVQNAFLNHIQAFGGIVGLADAMGDLLEIGITDSGSKRNRQRKTNVITDGTWNAYRKGGKKATFLIKVLFREHSTWQGIIYWREGGEKQRFRSFMEMVFLIASATAGMDGGSAYEYRYDTGYGSTALKEG